MNYAPKEGWKLGTDSFSKLIVWFKDGNIRTMYSIDWTYRYGLRDREVGLQRLKRKVLQYGIKAKAAIIYDVQTGRLLHRYANGNKMEKIE